MTLKINKYTFENITNKDWILDNGTCYQCVTLKHLEYNQSHGYRYKKETWTIMSKTQFKKLLKDGLIVRYEELEKSEKFTRGFKYCGCKAYRFNVEEQQNAKHN